jgi:hypothetical protein
MRADRAAAVLGFAGDLVPGVRFATSTVTAVVRFDLAEVARREHAGVGAVTQYRLIEALAALPLEWPVPWADLDPIVAAVLDQGPPGIVRRTPRFVERVWRPAVAVTGVFTSATDWRRGLEAVGVFGPDAPRGLVLRVRPRDHDELLAAAERFGIGIVAPDCHGEWQRLVDPARVHAGDPGPRHWRFLEAVYAASLRSATRPALPRREGPAAEGSEDQLAPEAPRERLVLLDSVAPIARPSRPEDR